ncbi:MAG: hypothetical protein JWM64_1958 [Frankiales bacterium]|nr:hypothetical protein [Frankiales bacterium]
MDGQGLGAGPLSGVHRLTGGTQNLLVAFSRGESRYVLRRPPVEGRPRSRDTVRREARVLQALGGTAVPHPALLGHCPDDEPLGAPFLLTEHVEGASPWEAGLPADPAQQHAVGLAVVDAFAALARVDVRAVGLGDLGRTDDWLARQPERWRAQLASYAALDGEAGARLPLADEVHAWLGGSLPGSWTPGLVHGDAHLGNVLVRADRPEVSAVVDWELATLGDPLLDLGQLLATWPVAGTGYGGRVDAPSFPTPAEVVARWSERSGRSTADLPWFAVLASYRLGVLLEGTRARARAGLASAATGDVLHERALGLVRRAHDLIPADGEARVGLRD